MDGGVGARAEGSVGWQVAAEAQLRSARLYTQRRTPLIINSPRKQHSLLSQLTIRTSLLTFILCSTVHFNNALTIQAQLVLHVKLIVYYCYANRMGY